MTRREFVRALGASLAIGVSGPLLATKANADAKTEKESLRGTWLATSLGAKGEVKGTNVRLIFAGDELCLKKGDETLFRGKFKIDATKQPNAIDVEIAENPRNKELVGKTARGIFELKGDALKWCLNNPGDPTRPKHFAQGSGAPRIVAALKREKNGAFATLKGRGGR